MASQDEILPAPGPGQSHLPSRRQAPPLNLSSALSFRFIRRAHLRSLVPASGTMVSSQSPPLATYRDKLRAYMAHHHTHAAELSPLLSACLEDLKNLDTVEQVNRYRTQQASQGGKRDGVIFSEPTSGSSMNVDLQSHGDGPGVIFEHDMDKCECRRGFITIACVEYSNALFAAEVKDAAVSEKGGDSGLKEESEDDRSEQSEDGNRCLTPTASEFGDESSVAEAWWTSK